MFDRNRFALVIASMLLTLLGLGCEGTSFTSSSGGRRGGDDARNGGNPGEGGNPGRGDDDDDHNDDDDSKGDDDDGTNSNPGDTTDNGLGNPSNGVDCNKEPSRPECAGFLEDQGELTKVRRFSLKSGATLDGLWDFKLNYQTGEMTLNLSGTYENGTMVFSVTKGDGSVEDIRINDGQTITIANWRAACDAAPTGWSDTDWVQAYGDPSDRKRKPVITMTNVKPVIHWTGDDDLEGASGGLRFDNLDFGLKYTCN